MYITNRTKTFNKNNIKAAIRHAKEEFPNESCGAIISGKYVRFKNAAEDTSNTFLIQDSHFARAYVSGSVDCVIHSHNNYDKASKEDQQQQLELDVPFGIINMDINRPKHVVFWGDTLPIEPLEGRQFFYGVWDCYSLVRDYIRLNTEYTPPNPARDWDFWNKGVSMFEGHIEQGTAYDFIDIKDAGPGDVLLYSIHHRKYINHCGILIENDRVIHHVPNQPSQAFQISYLRKYLKAAMRHNTSWYGE